MEALGSIVLLVVGGLLLFILYMLARYIVGGFIKWIVALLPFAVGIIGGLCVWAGPSKQLGNIIVVLGIVVGIPWVKHVWGKPYCGCIIHKTIDFFERVGNP
jgi:hypothetical protein